MGKILLTTLLCSLCFALAAQEIEKIAVPGGVVYKYAAPGVYEKAKQLLRRELSDSTEYTFIGSPMLIIGPEMWKRFSKIKSVKDIKDGNTTLLVDDEKLEAKLIQRENDGRLVWDELKKEVAGGPYTLRKATQSELKYYWSVISFDIEEPLIILETRQTKYILNFVPDTMKLLWLDEVPK